MENIRPRWRPTRPDTLRKLQRLEEFRRNNPELYELRLSKKKEEIDNRRKYFIQNPDIKKIRRAARLARLEKTGRPEIYGFQPCSISDTSEATCYTKKEDDMYKKHAVEDPLECVFKVYNPKTGLPDEVFTACVIERYREYHSAKRDREDQCVSSVTAMPTSSGEVPSAPSNETVVDDVPGNN